MRSPYSLSSDHHAHDWSQFAKVEADGVNSRLRIVLNEMVRQAQMTRARGWTKLRFAGDLFHVRGKLTPSVLNPTIATIKKICTEMGCTIDAIAGNHDLEGIESNAIGNGMQALAEIDGFNAITVPTLLDDGVFMVPWIQDLDELRKVMADPLLAGKHTDLIIHAPVNGVIKGIPDHGLEADELKALGYHRAFSGHYHNHVDFGDGVFSIGATAHQTWSDPGTKAGFMLVDTDDTQFVGSCAPKFYNVDKPQDVSGVTGNYVRLRLVDEEEAVIKKTREVCEANSLGVVDHSSKKRPTVRGAVNVQAGLTLEAAVTSYCRDHLATPLDRDRVASMALATLNRTMSA